MDVGSICSPDVDTIRGHQPVSTAAQRMLQRNVGSLVVVDEDRKPVGIVTDRDLTVRVMARGLPYDTPVEKVMTTEVKCVRETHLIEAALNTMWRTPCRRLPVVDAGGALTGILTLDDIHEYHAEESGMMRGVLHRERPERAAEQ